MAETAYASTFIAGLFASQSAEQTPVKFSCASTPITTGDAVPLESKCLFQQFLLVSKLLTYQKLLDQPPPK